jgi:hypothetical protein
MNQEILPLNINKYLNKISIIIYIIMKSVLDVMQDIKQDITDNEYKTIMDSLMKIHKINNNRTQQLNKFASFSTG